MLLDSASQHRTGCSAHASYGEPAIGKQRVFGRELLSGTAVTYGDSRWSRPSRDIRRYDRRVYHQMIALLGPEMADLAW